MGRVISSKEKQQENNPGLYVISTPIGNLLDFSQRAKNVLKDCDLVLAEDTRIAMKLLNTYGINKKRRQIVSCHKFNETRRLKNLNFEELRKQMVGLMADAGTPSISDPGSKIVEKYHQLGLPVRSVPGCCSVTAGFSISGIELKSNQTLTFGGFFPKKKKDVDDLLEKLSTSTDYVVFFESANRMENLVQQLEKFFQEDLDIFLAKEMTKIHESTWKGLCSELLTELQQGSGEKKEKFFRGEFVVIVDLSKLKQPTGSDKELEFWLKTLKPHVKATTLVKILSKKFGKDRQEMYSTLLIK